MTYLEELAAVREWVHREVNRRLTECGMRRAYPRTTFAPTRPAPRPDDIDGDMVYVTDGTPDDVDGGSVVEVWTVVLDRWVRSL